MHTRKMQLLQDGLCLLAGALMPLPFAPFNDTILAIFYPALLLTFWLHATPKRSFRRGFLFGLGFFGVGVSWVYVSINTYGNTSPPVAALITACFIAFLALFPAAQGYILTRFFPENNWHKLLLAFPALWVLSEWLRGTLFTGFPWLLVGNSQLDSPLHGLTPIVGVYGVSWAVTLTSGLIVAFFLPTHKVRAKFILLFVLITLWTSAFYLTTINWTTPVGNKIKVALIQGNVPQEVKWESSQIENIMAHYYQMSANHWNNALIIWPEAAITVLQSQAQPFLTQLDTQAKNHQATLITGIPIAEHHKYYNGMLALGAGEGVYLKRHLVPFGEYLIFDNLLRGLINFLNIPMSNLSPGPTVQPLLTVGNMPVVGFICYEIAYPEEVRAALHNAELIVTITDDSWFGYSIAAAQQLQITQMRALETGRYLLAGTNNGITAIINEKGRITARAPAHLEWVLTGEAQPMTGTTPWVRIGIWPILLIMGVLLGIGLISKKDKAT